MRQSLIRLKDPRYKAFLNSIIAKNGNNMDLWFHRNDKLYVIIRGEDPRASFPSFTPLKLMVGPNPQPLGCPT